MKKFKFLSFILLLFTMLSVISCGDEPLGKWERMKWNNVDNLDKVNNVYVIPENGGTFTFECKNYTPWLSGVIIISGHQDILSQENWNGKEYKNDWLEVKVVDKKVIFTFSKMGGPGETSRSAEIGVTAGDIFDSFMFQQEKK